MDDLLLKLQIWLHGNGANNGYGVWDVLGNKVQDIRIWLKQ